MKPGYWICLLLILLLLSGCGRGETAQQGPVVVTFACYPGEEALYEELADAFHAENPGIVVQIVAADAPVWRGGSSAEEQLDQSAETLRVLAGAGDTFHWFASPKVTPPEYVLNLAPLIDRIDEDDFYAGALDAFRWDGGLWGLPYQTTLITLVAYDRAALTEAGLDPPALDWSREDLREMARALTLREGDDVTRWGFVDPGLTVLQSMLMARPMPRLDTPEMAQVVRWYLDLAMTDQSVPWGDITATADMYDLTQHGKATMWTTTSLEAHGASVALLPGGYKGLILWGVAVSAATEHPQEALRWAEFLTRQPPRPGFLPARRSTAERWGFWDTLDEDTASVYRYGLERASVPSYVDVMVASQLLSDAILTVKQNGVPVEQALAQAQAQWQQEVERLAVRPTPTAAPIVVATPRPVDIGGTATTIRFTVLAGEFDELDTLRDLADAFHAEHPDVIVNVQMLPRARRYPRPSVVAQQCDCFRWWASQVDAETRSLLRPLDPMVEADAALPLDDFYPGLLESYYVEGQLWGLPAQVRLRTLNYDRAAFDAAGVDYPTPGWTLDDFLQTAVALTEGEGDNKRYGFAPGERLEAFTLVYFLQQRGAELVEREGDEIRYHLDDSRAAAALRWYADLVTVHGVMPPPAPPGATGAGGPSQHKDEAMWANNSVELFAPWRSEMWKVAVMPQGEGDLLLRWSNGYYITAHTAYPEACWEWIRFLSEHLEAGGTVSPRRSLVESEAYRQRVGAEAAAVFHYILEHAVGTPVEWDPRVEFWLMEAYRKVVDGGDAEAALQAAQRMVETYEACVATLGGAVDEVARTACALEADPDYPTD
ncbi:MAG: extracellular solute-binding protein [Chloroflexota bacterium]|nr:extracellular solute-binding protein [Chloroflexota bacterium]